MVAHTERSSWVKRFGPPVLLLGLLLLVVSGLGTRVLSVVTRPMVDYNTAFLERSTADALELMVPVGVAKGAADIVEGTTLSFEAGVGVAAGSQVELGDALQPILDCLNLAWRVLILSIVFSTVAKYILNGGQAVTPVLMGVALAGFLLSWLLQLRLRSTNALSLAVGRIARMCLLVALVVALVLPLTIYLSGHLSTATVSPLESEVSASFERAGEVFSMEGFHGARNVGDKARYLYEKSVLLMKYALESSADIAGSVARLVVAKVLNGVVFPLVILAFLVWLVRGTLYPALGLSQRGLFRQDLLRLADVLNPRDESPVASGNDEQEN